ncbi:hypothetical protein J421_5007 (plasmid) [Gemmatirosa kalamazoonensis]|uniref:Protein ImuB n=1 Tax=Gemmatirosa kalamazoonensis TaxID=861299 RepID=W0RPX7_9BACT|nr:hypothetical protein J421_5007 [Gemmatirosa kalamazoonensis]
MLVRPTEDGGTLVWVDARGLSARRVAAGALAAARAHLAPRFAVAMRVGVSRVAIAAELAARTATNRPTHARMVVGVAPRAERAFLAALPLRALLATHAWSDEVRALDVQRVVTALADVGVLLCGELAALAPDAVAVRYGAAGAALWRLARADDPRRLFVASPRELPSASVEWTTYELRDPERLAFVAHRLVERVVTEVRGWGDAARSLVLRFLLAGGGVHETPVRGARPSSDVTTWSRLVRTALERVVLPDGVVGLALRVETAASVEAPQGDLFDRGFQSGSAAESAVARLIDDGAGVPVRMARGGHALPERRASWRALEFREVAQTLRAAPPLRDASSADAAEHGAVRHAAGRAEPRVLDLRAARARQDTRAVAASAAAPPALEVPEALALRVLPEPREIVVTTRARRGMRVPARYRERLADGERAPSGRPLVEIATALGPDRVFAGGEAGDEVRREYWQCLTDEGRLVLLYRDVHDGRIGHEDEPPGSWYLQGWWD